MRHLVIRINTLKKNLMAKFNNPFIRDLAAYRRDVDPVNQYIRQAGIFLERSTGTKLTDCIEFIKATVRKNGSMPLKDHKFKYTERNEFEDREVTEGSYIGYIMDSVKRGLIVAPTLTSYLPHDQVTSHHVGYIEDRISRRSAVKKEMYTAIANSLNELADSKNIEQNGLKTGSNSLSGAQASMYNALFNPSAHSTLTSNCRATSSYGSVNNEKFLAGNRHYWSYDVVFNNITSIISQSDLDMIANVTRNMGLHMPTAQDVCDCVTHSSNKYWRNATVIQRVYEYAEKLSPVERAAFVYIGDLYHLMKHNRDIITKFLTQLSEYVHYDHVDVPSVLKNATDSYKCLAVAIMDMEMAGLDFNKIKGTEKEKTVCSIISNIFDVVEQYKYFIQCFFVSDNVPASVAYFPDSIRDVVLTGDTDSTIYTVEQWVAWLNNGQIAFDQHCNAVAAAMIFLTDQTIVHILALMSTNMGIPKEHLFKIAMKNEYKFPVYIPTQVGKHYWANKSCQEGFIFVKQEIEIKGVHMKSSNAPKIINKNARQFLIDVLNDIQSKQKINLCDYIKRVITQEQEIMTSLLKGESTYFRFQQIKPSTSYKNPDPLKNNYAHYLFWSRVFAKDHGEVPKPPFMAIKANLTIRNKSDTNAWIESIESRHVKLALKKWLEDTGKTTIKTISIPHDAALSKGIPKEIMQVLDVRKTAFDLCKTFYLVLEALGSYVVYINERKRFILSDLYDITPEGDLAVKMGNPIPIVLDDESLREEMELAVAVQGGFDDPGDAQVDDCPF